MMAMPKKLRSLNFLRLMKVIATPPKNTFNWIPTRRPIVNDLLKVATCIGGAT
ncbi:hypothetical protein [Clostridium lacusfryxellense]|uniref:hypothetical protein n=1 Tax=Clostridium lacusfryxellense TaxID=205328 RepID=UPI001C0E7945|nr:hypothetical protein [Clostridium lacusfryxellense]MBU3110336.1 hypothetical protein [Clostridium lacusfryxellense]